jgi:hypothetical protein
MTRLKVEQLSPLIHIGFSKALSTWLQRQLFLNKHGFTQVMEPFSIQYLIVDPSPFTYSSSDTLDWANQELDKEPQGHPVVTSEALSGQQQCGGYNARLLADRLHDTFPTGKVLLIIREQKKTIRSLYNEHIKFGMPHSIERVLNPVRHRRSPQFTPDYLRYDLLINYYISLYGSENVQVLAYEQFLLSPEEFTRQIYNFAGIGDKFELYRKSMKFKTKENSSLSMVNLHIERIRTRWLSSNNFNYAGIRVETGKSWMQRIERLSARELRIPNFVKSYFEIKAEKTINKYAEGLFKESNQRTAQLTNIDLESLGYDI